MRKICFGTVMVNLKPENNYQVHLVEIYPNKASGKKQINFSGTPEEVRSYMKTYMNQNNLFSNKVPAISTCCVSNSNFSCSCIIEGLVNSN